MEGTSTPGYELTLLIVSDMFTINICVVRSDFLWLSRDVPLEKCQVILVLILVYLSGEYIGTKSTCGKAPIYVGPVPKMSVNKNYKKSPSIVQTSTPLRTSEKDPLDVSGFMDQTVSPIVLKSVDEEQLVNIDEENHSNPPENGLQVEDQNRNVLNIKDIGNTTSDLSDKSVLDQSKLLLTPTSVVENGTIESSCLDEDNNPHDESEIIGVNGMKTIPTDSKSIDADDEETLVHSNATIDRDETLVDSKSVSDKDATQVIDKTTTDNENTRNFDTSTLDPDKTECFQTTTSDPDRTLSNPSGSPTAASVANKVNGLKADMGESEISDMGKNLNVEKLPESEIVEPSAPIHHDNRSKESEIIDGEECVEPPAPIPDDDRSEDSEIIDGEEVDNSEVKTSKQTIDKSMSTSYDNVIPDTEQFTKKKRLGTTRRVSVLTQKKVQNNDEKSSESESEEEHYYDYTVWKLGCPKCDDTFHSHSYYKQHLFKSHRITDVDRYPPVVLDKIYEKHHDPLWKYKYEGEHKCDDCEKAFMDFGNFLKHKPHCRKRTASDEEEAARSLYGLVYQHKMKGIPHVSPPRGRPKKRRSGMRTRSDSRSPVPSLKRSKIFDKKPVEAKFVGRKDPYKSKEQKEQKHEELDKSKEDSNDDTFEPEEFGPVSSEEPELAKLSPLPSIKRPRTRSMKRMCTQEKGNAATDSDGRDPLDILSQKIEKKYQEKKRNKGKKCKEPIPEDQENIQPAKKTTRKSEISDANEEVSKQGKKKTKKSEIIDESEAPSQPSNKKKKKSEAIDNSDSKSENSGRTKAEKKELGAATKRRLRSAGIEIPEEKEAPAADKKKGKGKKRNRSESSESHQISGETGENKKAQVNTRKRKAEIIEESKDEQTKAKNTKKSGKKTTKKPSKKQNDDDETYFTCHVCAVSFKDHSEYKMHKIKCTRVPKKHVCEKCGKGFNQKTLLRQHFNFRHTSKPKEFVCKLCKTAFELKKTLQEHNNRLHNSKDSKYLCDVCSRGFWHWGEFTLHRASHTGLKPFKCGRCGVKAFACAERLTKHLESCGKMNSVDCTKCGKLFSNERNLATHVSEVHDKEIQIECPLCIESVYYSTGGYYSHMRTKHNIGRKGQKLADVLLELQAKKDNLDKQKSSSEKDAVSSPEHDATKLEPDESIEKTASMENYFPDMSSENQDQTTLNETKDNKEEENKEDSKEEQNEAESMTGKEDNPDGNKKQESNKQQDREEPCPFPMCKGLVLANDEEYFKHLASVHNLHRGT